MASVRSYIIDLEENNKEVVEKAKQAKTKANTVYTTVLENDMDFVINRKTAKTEKEFVYLLSQELFYIKDVMTGEVTDLKNNENATKLANFFFKDMDKANYKLEKNVYIKNINYLFADYEVYLYDYLALYDIKNLNDSSYCRNKLFAIKSGIFKAIYDSGAKVAIGYSRPSAFFISNKGIDDKEVNIIKYLFSKIDEEFYNHIRFNYTYDGDGIPNFNTFIKTVLFINNKLNYNNAVYFIDKEISAKMNITFDGSYANIIENLNYLMTCKYDFNTLIDYVFDKCFGRGYECVGKIIGELRDYCALCSDNYGKISNKYPELLKIAHDNESIKNKRLDKLNSLKGIEAAYNINKNLEYKGGKYSVTLPKDKNDFIQEGQDLSHCVANYANRVAKRETRIAFMRLTEEMDKSLVTIEINNDDEICQVRGNRNRSETQEEKEFIKEWAKVKNLKY